MRRRADPTLFRTTETLTFCHQRITLGSAGREFRNLDEQG